MALADGCNWGEKPKEAARIATKQIAEHVEKHGSAIKNTMQAGEVLLHGFMVAHKNILDYNQSKKGRPANTTLMAVLILPLAKPVAQRNVEYTSVCVCCSVGDCTLLHFDSELNLFRKLFTDRGGRQHASNASDSGGFLGPSKSQAPDIRNLALDFCLLRDSDCVVLMSDGVSDNLDPEMQGFLPSEIPGSSVSATSWKDLEVATDLKNSYLVYLIPKLISLYNPPLSPSYANVTPRSAPLPPPRSRMNGGGALTKLPAFSPPGSPSYVPNSPCAPEFPRSLSLRGYSADSLASALFPQENNDNASEDKAPEDSLTTEQLFERLKNQPDFPSSLITPSIIVDSLVRFSKHLTSPLRSFYDSNPNASSASTFVPSPFSPFFIDQDPFFSLTFLCFGFCTGITSTTQARWTTLHVWR